MHGEILWSNISRRFILYGSCNGMQKEREKSKRKGKGERRDKTGNKKVSFTFNHVMLQSQKDFYLGVQKVPVFVGP